MDVHSSAAGLSIIAVLQDDQGIDIVSQTAFTSVVNEWETLSFDMSAATGPASNIVFSESRDTDNTYYTSIIFNWIHQSSLRLVLV